MYTMELPSQSGLVSPGMDPGTDSDSDQGHARVHSNRKSNKPLLEKKRRARINKSLDQLKGLVLEALKKDSARYSKLEKADILEMTVKHLREVQRHQMTVAMSMDPTVVGKFRTGFGECAQEVDRYLSTIDGLSAEVRLRLMQHLSRCSGQLQHVATSFPGMGGPVASQHPAAPGISVFPGIPSASPPQALPGMGIRCSLPFGGLALSSPESPPSLSHAYTPSPEPRSTPKAHHQQQQHGAHPPKSEVPPGFSSSKRDDAENVAPGRSQRPLAEKRFNTNLRVGDEFGDRNNNSAHGKDYLPPTKRQKREASYFHGNGYHNDIRRDAHNLLAMDIKMEPVWRPW